MRDAADHRAQRLLLLGLAPPRLGLGLFAPANTPRAVVARLSEAVAAAGNDPGVARELAAGGVDTTPSTPAELDALSRSEFERYRKLFQAAGIKPQ